MPPCAADTPDFELVFAKMPGLCLILNPSFVIVAQSEPRPPQAGKTVQWTVLSGERRELGRAASMPAPGGLW
jgi:hypothetical protein